jgi:hypothetical protein
MERFGAAEAFFRATRRFRNEDGQTAKGMAFVQMYAAYEYTVNTAVQASIDAIMAHAHAYADLRPSLLAIFLQPQLQSLKACAPKNEWENRLALFEMAYSAKAAVIPNVIVPSNGTHYRQPQLRLTFKVMGIKRLPARRIRHLQRIDEVVEHRNAIAHGRETPGAIGRRYSRKDIRRSMRQVKSVCLLFVDVLQSHCSIATEHRR